MNISREIMELSVLRSSLAWPKMIFDLMSELDEDDFKTDICRSLYIGIQKLVENRRALSHESIIKPFLKSDLITNNVKHYVIENNSPRKGNVIELLSYLSISPNERLAQFKNVASQYIKRFSKIDPKAHLKPSSVIIKSEGNVVYFRGF
jgi:hypothetical protein